MSQWDDGRKPTTWEWIVMDWQHDWFNSKIKYWLVMAASAVFMIGTLWYKQS